MTIKSLIFLPPLFRREEKGEDTQHIVPIYITLLMVIRSVQQLFKRESPAWHHTWIPFVESSG